MIVRTFSFFSNSQTLGVLARDRIGSPNQQYMSELLEVSSSVSVQWQPLENQQVPQRKSF
jgi:hypothetical protein